MLDLKTTAADFLRQIAAGEVSEAFAHCVSPTFRHHNPFFHGDAKSLREAMQEKALKCPNKVWGVQHVLQDGEFVAVRSRVRLSPPERGGAFVHLVRFRDNRIEELWDIGQTEPEKMINPQGMFRGTAKGAREPGNRRWAREYTESRNREGAHETHE